ncbi:MAG: hypothetical protein WCT52_06000 [Candidatus Micrarchaeia archaeon]
MAGEKEFLKDYSRFSPKASPADFLSGDSDKRDVEITFIGKKSDDLGGAVKRRFLSDLNRFFWEHPKDVDDTRLVFEAIETGAEYAEKKDGGAKLVLKISIGLAQHAPDTCGCC